MPSLTLRVYLVFSLNLLSHLLADLIMGTLMHASVCLFVCLSVCRLSSVTYVLWLNGASYRQTVWRSK